MKDGAAPVIRDKLPFRHERGWGQVLTLGQGDTGMIQVALMYVKLANVLGLGTVFSLFIVS